MSKTIYTSTGIPQPGRDSHVLVSITADTETGYGVGIKLETRNGTTVANPLMEPGEALALAASLRRAAKLTIRAREHEDDTETG